MTLSSATFHATGRLASVPEGSAIRSQVVRKLPAQTHTETDASMESVDEEVDPV
jgi:hypothetical protein